MPEPLSPFRRLVIAEPGTVRIEVRCSDGPSLWAVIDVEDETLVSRYAWSAEPNPWTTYATASTRVDGTERRVVLHRLIMSPPDNMVVDHIDHNGLNNRRANLRIATQKQNAHNRKAVRGSTSRYKGVSRNGRGWTASIGAGETREYLGSYATEEEAARVFDWRSHQLYGEFALLNFPDDLRETPPAFQQRMADRQVYGLTVDGHEITRYGPGGRYYVESGGRKLRWVTMREAARLIARGQWNAGIPGGRVVHRRRGTAGSLQTQLERRKAAHLPGQGKMGRCAVIPGGTRGAGRRRRGPLRPAPTVTLGDEPLPGVDNNTPRG